METSELKAMDQLLTTEQVAKLFNVRPGWLVQMRYLGSEKGPPYVKLGRLVRYRYSDLMRWLEENRIEMPKAEQSRRMSHKW